MSKSTRKNIEAVYPLSPTQQGMLFHSLYDRESGVYVEQLAATLVGDLDINAFHQAWQRVTDRHAVLRTSFAWKRLDQMMQVVHKRVDVPLLQEDWRGASGDEQEKRLSAFMEAERRQGFDLARAPLMRLALMRIDDDRYYFVWSHHHALLDGWSLPLVLQEVFAFYEGFRQGQDVLLPPSRPYRDYIDWLGRQDESAAEAFWREQLRGFTAPTSLVVQRSPRDDGEQSMQYGKQEVRLSREVTARLQDMVRRQHLTMSTVLQGAWALLLSRYNQESDVLFGATVAGRPADLPGVERMVGLFINTIPVRVQVDESLSVSGWLQAHQQRTVEARQFEYAPLAQIQQWSDVPAGSPLFESILVFENYPKDAASQSQSGSLAIEDVHSVEYSNYPLAVVTAPADEMTLRIRYDRSRFDDDAISRMVGHLAMLLTGMAADPERPVAEVPMLSDNELYWLLQGWNDTSVEYPAGTVIDFFEARAAENPQATALVFGDERWSYGMLNARANQLAHHLRALGVGRETPVGILMTRSPRMIQAVLAVLKAGGAYVPLDPDYPRERVHYMIEDAGISIVLTEGDVDPGRYELDAIQFLTPSDLAVDAQSEENLDISISSDDLAYILYTSGSTGRPKGVMVQHGGLANYLHWVNETLYGDDMQALPFTTKLSFDASLKQFLAPLLRGGQVWGVPETIIGDPVGLLEELGSRERIGFNAVPSLWRSMIDAIRSGAAESPGERLSRVLLGGEALSAELVADTQTLLPHLTIYNVYGPTEATANASMALVTSPDDITIGYPLANTRLYVLDERMRPLPIGVPGELYIGGAGVVRGYLNRPEKTAQAFVVDPFGDEPGERLYRSGDVVRRRADGALEFLGRLDQQVKISGYRIELGEIEAVLRDHPDIAEAVVVVRAIHREDEEDNPEDRRLVGYIVPVTASAPTTADLRAYLQERLPSYMIPAIFITLDALPLMPNGKIDRKALPDPEGARPLVDVAYRAPRSPVEEMLAELWGRVLGIQRVGIDDDFFELGGHSLLATRLVSRVREVFQVDLPLQQVFESPTIAAMAAYIESVLRDEGGVATPPIEPVPRDGDLPLSYAQQRLWFLDQLQPDSPFYNVPMALRLQGELDIDALEQSLNEIVRRHETLRTTFQERHGAATQVIASELPIPLPVEDLTHLPAAEQEDAAHKLALAEVLKPFDLSKGPLLRVRLLKLADDDHIAVVAMHHIISDAWSMRVFFREMAVLYNSFSQGRPSPLPPLPIQYADYAAWQRQWLQGDVLERQMDYWRKQLEGSPGLLALPTDRPRPPVQTANGANLAFEVPPELAEQLRAFARKEGATLFMVVLAAFQVLLYRYTGQDDVSVGSPIANRNRPEIENLIGFFLNTLVLRTDLSGEPGFRELVKRVREVVMGAFAHQDLPFEMLVEELQPERDLSHTPLFQVGFTLQIASNEAISLPSLALAPVQIDSKSAKYDITLLMSEGPEGLLGNFEYNTDLFDRTTIERMAGHLLTLLDGFMADPDLPIPYAPILTSEEQELLLSTWNDTTMPAPIDRCAHELFEARVEQHPDALAVIFEEQQLTYADLNRRANQLARYLRRLGVGPETLVAISTERSPEMIVGILATMKAGGAYLPVDPTYPSERIAFMLSDAGAPIMLTQEHLLDRLPPHDARDVLLDAEWSRIAQEEESNLDRVVTPENTAYVIYTSGSTGKPKGAALRHRGLSNLAEVQRLAFNVQEGSRVLQFAPFSFDASVWETFMALANGGTLCLARQEQLASGQELLRLMQTMKINIVTLPPSVLTVLHPQSLPDLKVVIAAGEKCTAEIVQQWAPGRMFFNAYGPTETTVCASMYRCSPDEKRDPPIGRPIGNSRLYVVDANLQITPVGVPGELVIGGVNVGRGYLNRPELTEQKFIPDPFAGPDDRLYRTGDLVRWLPDGNIEFLGRIDHQVKIRGFRIELGEIESVLRQHPGITDVVVMAREIGDDRRLVAYLLAEETADLNSTELRDFIRLSLPDYMVPSHFVIMDAFPLSPAGKVDRKALPDPDSSRIATEADYVAPRTETEETLAAIAAELLAVDQVGVHDNFFELGGHSLLATQFISRVREAFDVDIELRVLFEHPTVAEIAGEIDSRRSESEQVTDTIADLLSQLDQMSDDEVKRLLEDSE
jgi:amino acid adenylation domain-containing protein